MVPAHASVQLELLSVVVVEVHTKHLRRVQSVAPASEVAPSASTRKALVVHIVGVAHEHEPQLVREVCPHEPLGIPVFRSVAHVGVAEESAVHAALQCEVEHGLLVAVVNARHSRQVALVVVCLHLLYDGRGKVFQSRLSVSRHELLAVHLYLLHLLSVDGHLAVVVYLCARQTLYQLFYHRAFRRPVSRRVVHQRVFSHHHPCGMSRHGGSLQHRGFRSEHHLAHVGVRAVLHLHVLESRDVSHA